MHRDTERASERARMAPHRSLSYPLLAEPRNTPAERKRRGCCAGRSSDGKVKFSPWPLKVTTDESDDLKERAQDPRNELQVRASSHLLASGKECKTQAPTYSERAGREEGREGTAQTKVSFHLGVGNEISDDSSVASDC